MQHPLHNEIADFTKKKELNKMYAYIAIQHLGIALVGIFVPIYYYELGFSIQLILAQYIVYEGLIALLLIPAAKLISRWCVNKSFIVSLPFRILYFALLIYLPQYPWLFWILPVVLAIRFSLYNTAYHLNFLYHTQKKGGKKVAGTYILFSVASFISPYVGALIITYLGYDAVFWVSMLIILVSITPVLIMRDTCPTQTFSPAQFKKQLIDSKYLNLNLSFLGYSFPAIAGFLIWPIFLFIFLKSHESVGLITSLSLIVAVMAFWVIGRWSDTKDPNKLISSGSRLWSLSWVIRTIALTPVIIGLADVFKNITQKMVFIPWSARFYELARKRNALEFIVAREMMFHAPRVIFLTIAIVFFDHLDSFWAFITSFIMAAVMILLIPTFNKFVSED